MTADPFTELARDLIADGRRDREVLRRRWNAPSWRAEIERIADVLARHPLLIPAVERTIADELRRLGESLEAAPPDVLPAHSPNTETIDHADRQDATLSNI